jgi:uncharacterized SAM-binding protein YcdF (DUF218 family)
MLSALLTPFALLHLVMLVGLVRLWRKHRDARRGVLLVAVPFLLLWVLNTPTAAFLLGHPLERSYAPQSEEVPPDAQAIVVLAGSTRAANAGRARPEPGPATLYRCVHALALHRKAPHLPIVVSGGVDPDVGAGHAEVMRDFLVAQGVPPAKVSVEARSANTYENAVETAQVLQSLGAKRVVLVTDASHMWRAEGCFRAQGVEVIPSACNHLQPEYSWTKPSHTLPRPKGATEVHVALHEWAGLLTYRLRGRL